MASILLYNRWGSLPEGEKPLSFCVYSVKELRQGHWNTSLFYIMPLFSLPAFTLIKIQQFCRNNNPDGRKSVWSEGRKQKQRRALGNAWNSSRKVWEKCIEAAWVGSLAPCAAARGWRSSWMVLESLKCLVCPRKTLCPIRASFDRQSCTKVEVNCCVPIAARGCAPGWKMGLKHPDLGCRVLTFLPLT